jgi:hypothetical protein
MSTITEKIIARRKAVSLHWQKFLREPPPHLIAEVVERDDTEMPDRFVPWAPGVVVASDHLLAAAHHRLGSRPPLGWSQHKPRVFWKPARTNRLWVCGLGEFWTVEREIETVLVFAYGSMPIVTRSYQAAMRLAEYCHPQPAPGLMWVVMTPDGINWC